MKLFKTTAIFALLVFMGSLLGAILGSRNSGSDEQFLPKAILKKATQDAHADHPPPRGGGGGVACIAVGPVD